MEKTNINIKDSKLKDRTNIVIVVMSLIVVGLLVGTSYLGWLYRNGEKNAVVIYYVGYEKPYIEYRLEQEGWCPAPGIPLDTNDDKEYKSYTHKIMIPLDNSTKIIGKFNDGNGKTDDNSGQYYEFYKGVYLYDNGNLVRLDQMGSFAITSFKSDAMNIMKGQSVTLKVSTMGGEAPITYKFSVINEENKETVIQDFSSSEVAQLTAQKEGQYTFVVVAKDKTGLTQASKIEGVTVSSLELKDIKPSVPSPQCVGTKIDLNMTIENSAKVELNCSYEIQKASGGDEVILEASSDGMATWEPTEEGEYIITGHIKGGDFEAKKEIKYVIGDKQQVEDTKLTIFYCGLDDPTFYYSLVENGGGETNCEKMKQDSTMDGYSYKVEINVPYDNKMIGYFGNDKGEVDNNNGQNYSFTTGYYGVKDGQLENLGVGGDEDVDGDSSSVVRIYSADKKKKYVNYKVNGQWQQSPGKEMQKIDEGDYKYYIEIPLQGQQSINVTFNKEHALWNNPQTYTLGAGTYYFKDDEMRTEE